MNLDTLSPMAKHERGIRVAAIARARDTSRSNRAPFVRIARNANHQMLRLSAQSPEVRT